MKLLITILTIISFSVYSFSQPVNSAFKGTANIYIDIGSKHVKAQSRDLMVNIDPTYSLFEAELPLNNLYTGIDSLDSKARGNHNDNIELKGNWKISSETDGRRQEFLFKGVMKGGNYNLPANGRGTINKTRSRPAYIFILDINVFGENLISDKLELLNVENIRIVITQPVSPYGESMGVSWF